MKNYILEKKMNNTTDGYFLVVIEGETHINRTIIKSDIQYFTTQDGYSYCHPYKDAEQNAQAIANGLNELERMKVEQHKRYPEYNTTNNLKLNNGNAL
jgi:hypothetical protein